MPDVIVIGAGFAGLTAARELRLAGKSCVILEARDRIGGRTWATQWRGERIEYGGGWVHWCQPHVFAEMTRAGLGLTETGSAERFFWREDGERHEATPGRHTELAMPGWERFVEGAREIIPRPHSPLFAGNRIHELDAMSIEERLAQIPLSAGERGVLTPEMLALAHGRIDDASAFTVLRWHALAGFSLEATEDSGGRFGIEGGTITLADAIAKQAGCEIRLNTQVSRVRQTIAGVEVTTVDGEVASADSAIVTVPLNVLGTIEFDPPLAADQQAAIAIGQSSQGIKLWLHVAAGTPATLAIDSDNPLCYVMTDRTLADGSMYLVVFAPVANNTPTDVPSVQALLDEMAPGFTVLDVGTHDWTTDEYAKGTWATHRPGWYQRHHAAMLQPHGRVVFASADIANGWAGFVDGAIESGMRAARGVVSVVGN